MRFVNTLIAFYRIIKIVFLSYQNDQNSITSNCNANNILLSDRKFSEFTCIQLQLKVVFWLTTICKACLCFWNCNKHTHTHTAFLWGRKMHIIFYHGDEWDLCQQINANWSDAWVLDVVNGGAAAWEIVCTQSMIQENGKKVRHRHDDGKQLLFLLHDQRRDAVIDIPLMSSKLNGFEINLKLKNHVFSALQCTSVCTMARLWTRHVCYIDKPICSMNDVWCCKTLRWQLTRMMM